MSRYTNYKKELEEKHKVFISFVDTTIPGKSTKIIWKCHCGKENKTTMYSAIYHNNCHSCGGKNGAVKRGTKRATFDDFCKELKQKGWSMISEESEFRNTKSVMNVKCDQYHSTTKSLANFRKGVACKICTDNGYRNTINKVREEFESRGFKLLSTEYHNNKENLNYVCKCGKEAQITFCNLLRNKVGCKGCAIDKAVENLKKGYIYKNYAFPSGREIKIQGYENKALDFLLFDCGIYESDILHDREIDPIIYFYEEENHRYYPDLFIKCSNLFIEVKSKHIFLIHKEKNLVKFNTAVSQGLSLIVLVYDEKGLILHVNWNNVEDRKQLENL